MGSVSGHQLAGGYNANLVADTSLQLGDPGWVVWQTWKTGPEVYLADGTEPKAWLDKDFGLRSVRKFPAIFHQSKAAGYHGGFHLWSGRSGAQQSHL